MLPYLLYCSYLKLNPQYLRYLSSHLKRVASCFFCILKALQIKQQRQKRWGEEVFGALDPWVETPPPLEWICSPRGVCVCDARGVGVGRRDFSGKHHHHPRWVEDRARTGPATGLPLVSYSSPTSSTIVAIVQGVLLLLWLTGGVGTPVIRE